MNSSLESEVVGAASPNKEAGRKKGKEKTGEVKTRLTLSTAPDHPFSEFLGEVKKRGIKTIDPATIVLEALDRMDEEWWEEKLDEITPLEYKITAALSDPKMREKLTSLLATQKMDSDSSSSSLQ